MSTLYDNLVIQSVTLGNSCSSSNWYSRLDSSGQCVWTGKGAQSGYATASDYYIQLTEITANSDSKASPEADSYCADSSGRSDNAFVIDGGDTLTYSTTNIIKNNKGSIAFLWKAPLDYNDFVDDFYLAYLYNFMAVLYDASEDSFYFKIYNGTDWSTCSIVSTGQTFSSGDWLKFCVTWDTSAATTMALYIDSNTAKDTYASSWTAQTVPSTLYLGSYYTGISQSDGAFDEFRLYAVALTSAEVGTLFDTTWAGLG